MHSIRLVCFISLLGLSSVAQAGLVRFDFSGTLTQPFGTLANATPFSGSFVYETGQIGVSSPPGSTALGYNYDWFRFDIDGVTLQRGPAPVPAIGVEIYNDPTNGPTSFMSVTLAGLPGSSQLLGGRQVWRLYMWFYVPGDVVWPNNELPADASFFQQPGTVGQLFFNFIGESVTQQFDVDGRITSLTSTPVPLPAALPLFFAGLLGLAGMRKSISNVTGA